jgi:hypothetical protein
MVNQKPLTFRVRRIPATLTSLTLPSYLQSYFKEDNDAPIEIIVRSLAPSPDDWNVPAKQTATVEFTKLPHCFTDPAQTQWKIPSNGSYQDVLFDKDFLGFTPLNHVQDANHVCE